MAVPLTTTAAVTVLLYVGDLPLDITEAQLFEAFSDYKSLTAVRICGDWSSARSTCYAYVNLLSPQEAINAIEAKNHTMLNGRMLRFLRRNDRIFPSPDAILTNLYVKNLDLDLDVTEEVLLEKFSEFGKPGIAKEVDGTSRGFGFVNFDNPDDAKQATEVMNGPKLGGF
ncbi:hypothetical protein Ddye_008092 [Dipteronia dyeriana]|uniref:RRM domain-containing protein n=1 Tax=Dipteronia dyeriana TaxID=168575 RepID=A0AAD9X953_9ROSI|nr:hypothetical protein Ddye_008092 [Dipteronia dyeriana]